MRLSTALDSPETKSRYVKRLFSTIADRYDLITGLLPHGQDRRWKRRRSRWRRSSWDAGARSGLRYRRHDVALQAAGASSIGLDITARMLTIAVANSAGPVAGVHRWRHDGVAVPRCDVRYRHDRLRHPQRAGDRALARRDRACPSSGWRPPLLDFDRPSNGSVAPDTLPTSPSSVRARTRASWRFRHLSIYSESIRRYPGAEGVCAIAREQGFAACERFQVLVGSWLSTGWSNSTRFHSSTIDKPRQLTSPSVTIRRLQIPELSSVTSLPGTGIRSTDESTDTRQLS